MDKDSGYEYGASMLSGCCGVGNFSCDGCSCNGIVCMCSAFFPPNNGIEYGDANGQGDRYRSGEGFGNGGGAGFLDASGKDSFMICH